MDVAALSLAVDSSSVVKATADLDKFSTAAAKAGSSSGNSSGSIAKLVASAQSMDSKLSSIVSSLQKLASANDNVASSAQRVAAANENSGRSFAAADAHVVAYRNHLASLPAATGAAAAGVNRLSAAVRDGSQSMQATPGNIAAQFQDIGVTAAMGMSPLLIALQQGTQLSAAFAGGGLKSLGAALRSVISPVSLLTIALVALVAVGIQWAMEAAKSADSTDKLGKAIEKTQITTYAFGDAQSALGGVIDLTTGKIKTQSAALYGLARAQLEMIRATALKDRAEAAKTIAAQRGMNTPTWSSAPGASLGGMSATGIGLSGQTSKNEAQTLLDRFTSGKLTPTQAIDGMERLRKATKLTEEQFIQLTGAIASSGVAGENLKVYEDARKALGGDQAALQQFLNPDKSRSRGGKTDAEKLVDIYAGAQADIATEKARGLAEANSLGALEAAKLEKQTALLNSIQQKNIPITAAVRQKVDELAQAYATAKVDADVSKVINDTTDGIQRQRDAIADQTKLVGLYGDALARARREMDAERALRESLPKGEIYVGGNLTGGVSDDAEALARRERIDKIRREAELSAYSMDLERKSFGLTGAAALEYAFIADRLLENKRAGIATSPAEVAAINAAGEAYANQRHALDEYARTIADTREVTKGFFTDWINGVREGGNVFKSFADSVVNSLNRILDKLLDRGLDSFLDSMFKNGGNSSTGSSFLDSLLRLGTKSAAPSVPNALGGAYGTAQRFANGGAFTNRIVDTPTMFRFANGAALGEMGEAGPEAIMPLKRGPNGSLGVQAHGGGKSSVRMGDITNVFRVEGAFTTESMMEMVRQGGEATVEQVRRELQSMLLQLDNDGTLI
jgi:hypothetical protein